jgi:V8-like Glu-specific endopeptidase
MDRNNDSVGVVVDVVKATTNKKLKSLRKMTMRRREKITITTATRCTVLSILSRLLLLLSCLDDNSLHAAVTNNNNNHIDDTLDMDDPLDNAELPQHDDQTINKQQLQQPRPRIINGEDVTDPNRYPWFVHVRGSTPDNLPVLEACGGSLIAPDLVLTAAHCE